LKHGLHEYEQQKTRTKVGSIESSKPADKDDGSQKLKDVIDDLERMIRQHESEVRLLSMKAYTAMTAANLAAKSNIDVPGIGRWSPIGTNATVTTTTDSIPAPTTTPTTTTKPITPCITITTVQVKVADIPSDAKATATGTQDNTTLDVEAIVPRSNTAVMEVDSKLAKLILCPQQKQYANPKRVEPHMFHVGDIGWFPVLRPTVSESSSDIHTTFGYICAKSYPLLIVEKLDDCMLGLIISTSGGSGLTRKGPSVKSRSVPIVNEWSRYSTLSDWGASLHPRQKLWVDKKGEYSPPAGAYVDLLNVIMVPYDSRFKKEGNIVGVDALPLQQMRLSAFFATTGAGRAGGYPEFQNWLASWGNHFGIFPELQKIYAQNKAEAEAMGLAEGKKASQAIIEAEAKAEAIAKDKAEAQAEEEAREHEKAEQRELVTEAIAKKKAEVQAQEEARKHKEAKQRELMTEREEAEAQLEAKERLHWCRFLELTGEYFGIY
jgi:hypothetical protein